MHDILDAPEKIKVRPKFAEFGERFVAWLIDYFILATVNLVLVMVVELPDRILGLGDFGSWSSLSVSSLSFVIWIAYHTIFESAEKQGSIGKQIMKIQVVNYDGNQLTIAHALGRNAAKLISLLTLGIGYIMAAFNHRGQALHDTIASTFIVKKINHGY